MSTPNDQKADAAHKRPGRVCAKVQSVSVEVRNENLLTPRELELVQAFRRTDHEGKRMMFVVAESCVKTYPLHKTPELRLIVGGAA